MSAKDGRLCLQTSEYRNIVNDKVESFLRLVAVSDCASARHIPIIKLTGKKNCVSYSCSCALFREKVFRDFRWVVEIDVVLVHLVLPRCHQR